MKVRNNKFKKKIKNVLVQKLIENLGSIIFENEYISIYKNETISLFTTSGEKIKYNFSDILVDNINNSNILIFQKDNSKYGWINEKGEIIKDNLDSCDFFVNNVGIGILNDNVLFVDKNGNVILDEIENYGEFENGKIWYEKDGKEGWMTSEGKIIGYGFDSCYNFEEDYAKFRTNGKYGFVNSEGKVISEGFNELWFDDSNIFTFTDDDGEGYITNEGTVILSGCKDCFSFNNKSYGIFRNNDGLGLINKDGKILITNCDYLSENSEGYRFEKKESTGFISYDGIIKEYPGKIFIKNEKFIIYKPFNKNKYVLIDDKENIISKDIIGYEYNHDLKKFKFMELKFKLLIPFYKTYKF